MNLGKPRIGIGLGFASCAILLGASLALFPQTALVALLAMFAFSLLVLTARFGTGVFWAYLGMLLVGYAWLGKGFAYLGRAPLYVGEFGLVLAVVSMLLTIAFKKLKIVRRIMRGMGSILPILLFIVWGMLRTIPFLEVYGLNALRDAVIWGYAIYALVIFFIGSKDSVAYFVRLYGRILPFYLAWLPIGFTLTKLYPLGVRFQGSPVPIVFLKSGDVGVQLGGAAAFLLLRLDAHDRRWSTAKIWVMWILWWASWVAFGASNRAGMLSALMGMGVVILFRPKTSWYRSLFIAVLGMVIMIGTNFNMDLKIGQQEVSFEQFVDNFQSLVTNTDGILEGTKQWRLDWWGTIIDYTFGGEYRWAGKGYGINLAADDGFLGKRGELLRSPHNISMTVLARSGVIGLSIWVVLLLRLGWRTFWNSMLFTRNKDRRIDQWLLAFFIAFLTNASFDVFLEGPMGGIWFWSLVGLMLLQMQKAIGKK
jgi:hypothetical protein